MQTYLTLLVVPLLVRPQSLHCFQRLYHVREIPYPQPLHTNKYENNISLNKI
ncbi:hypothetical protein Hanom_Chr12g01078621 [Helianthus anomalus]